MTRKELSQAADLSSGGGLTQLLNELEESGFIARYTLFDKKFRNSIYRLTDFYSSFYLRFIKNNTNFEEGGWINAVDHPAQRAWAGFAYEQVCLSHVTQIKKALGISGILSQSFSWKSQEEENNAQIDLVIDRRDHVVNLCEIKYSLNEYAITKEYIAKLRNKIGSFRNETKTKKAIHLTMITTYGLKKNKYVGNVQNELTMDMLFE
jgi:hypothetical protein